MFWGYRIPVQVFLFKYFISFFINLYVIYYLLTLLWAYNLSIQSIQVTPTSHPYPPPPSSSSHDRRAHSIIDTIVGVFRQCIYQDQRVTYYTDILVLLVLLHSNGWEYIYSSTLKHFLGQHEKKKENMSTYPCACSGLSEGVQVGVQVKTRVYTAIMVPVSDYDNNETIIKKTRFG